MEKTPGNLTADQMNELARRIAAIATDITPAGSTVREYIGARYVPVFANPLQWSSENTYEPLTIVTDQGNSYTSTQYVPAGIELTNETFWVNTGNYNAQIEAYRQEVLNLAKEVEGLQKNKIVLFIGDSFTDTNNSPVLSPWPNYLGNIPGWKWYNFAYRGRTFYQDSMNHGFTAQLMAANDDQEITNDEVAKIIVYGGINDFSALQNNTVNFNQISLGVANCINYANQHFPNAELIMCLCNAGTPKTATYDKLPTFANNLITQAYQTGRVTVIKSVNWLVPYARISYGSDPLHPNTRGAQIIANKMRSIIDGTYSNSIHEFQFEVLNTELSYNTVADTGIQGTFEVGSKRIWVDENGDYHGVLQGVLNSKSKTGTLVFNILAPVNTVFSWGNKDVYQIAQSNRSGNYLGNILFQPQAGTLDVVVNTPINMFTVITF